MAQSRETRKLLRGLSSRASRAIALLQEREQEEIDVNASLAAGLEATPLNFMVFACLGTVRGKEELCLDLSETIFFRKFQSQAENLLKALRAAEVPSTLVVLLPDLEPRRTWGWQVPQDELTGLCHMMIEDAGPALPEGWTVRLWSDLEAGAHGEPGYAAALRWAMTSAPELVLRPETAFFRNFGDLHPDIVARDEPEMLARRQIAAYAHEGRVLAMRCPNAILLQADTPVVRKDAMFNLLRREPLAIVHPFTR